MAEEKKGLDLDTQGTSVFNFEPYVILKTMIKALASEELHYE